MKPICYVLSGLILLFLSCSPTDTEEIQDYPEMEEEVSTVNSSPPESSIEEQVRYWVYSMQVPNGLVESTEETDFVSLYDNALAAFIFIENGDLRRAEAIFDFFESRLEDEFYAHGGGFFQFRNTEGIEGSRTWLGDNAWLLLAINHYHKVSQSLKYKSLAEPLEAWIRSLQDTDGGLIGGYNEDGSEIPKVTEGIITAYSAVHGFDSFHREILRFLKEKRWDDAASSLKTDEGTSKYAYALDLHTLPALIFTTFPEQSLLRTDEYYTSLHGQKNRSFSGYCFDADRDVIWLEGTAQMALVYRLTGDPSKFEFFADELEHAALPSLLLPELKGLAYTTNQGSNFGATPLWDHADKKPAISSSCWYLMAKMGFNPFNSSKKEYPEEVSYFWENTTL